MSSVRASTEEKEETVRRGVHRCIEPFLENICSFPTGIKRYSAEWRKQEGGSKGEGRRTMAKALRPTIYALPSWYMVHLRGKGPAEWLLLNFVQSTKRYESSRLFVDRDRDTTSPRFPSPVCATHRCRSKTRLDRDFDECSRRKLQFFPVVFLFFSLFFFFYFSFSFFFCCRTVSINIPRDFPREQTVDPEPTTESEV